MNAGDAISISSGEDDKETYNERRTVLTSAISSVVEALGGLEGGAYRLGDECYGCLKDLKKYWRKDDTDDERTVARIFWKTRVLPNDLIPILLATAGNGNFEDKRAIACVDLMTAMTWPIDLAEELQELDEVEDKGTDYTELLGSHLAYKAALLKPEVMRTLLGIMLSCLAKTSKERNQRDTQVVHVVLYLLRNLAFIKDLPANMFLSADQAEHSSLQTRFIKLLQEAQFFDVLLTAASSSLAEPIFNASNTLVLDIFYLLFRGVKPTILAVNQVKEPARNLQRLLAAESQRKQTLSRNTSTRHSRFGTTVVVTINPKKPSNSDPEGDDSPSTQKLLLHRQQAISSDAGMLLDMTSSKRAKAQKTKKIDELGREDNLSIEAKLALQDVAKKFIESCFNPFLESLLKDIRAERPKITEKDNLRLLYVAKWFLEFFQAQRIQEPDTPLAYGLVAEVTDRNWIVWVLKRMRGAVEDKPKQWNELQAGIDCLTQLILLIEAMAASDEAEVADAAQTLQHQVIYNGEILDISLDSIKAYKDGTQSLAYLDSSVNLAYSLLRMLERWGKKGGTGEMYVRKRAKKKAKHKRNTEGMEVPDVEEEEPPEPEEEVIHETMFTFDAFEARFANPDVCQTLLAYLARYKEFTSPESMKRVVNLLHRQAVKAKAEGLFFNVSTLNLFKGILSEQKSLPRDQAHKDLVALVNFILRKFFKAVEEDSFVAVQAFFPKTRGHWKELSSWEPEKKSGKGGRTVEDTRFPPDVQVKKGYTWSQQLGIAMACLTKDGKQNLIDWVKEILMMVIGIRQRIIEDTDGSSSKSAEQEDNMEVGDIDEDELRAKMAQNGPSNDAMAKFQDYLIPYTSDEHADAACKNPHLKLMFRLIEFFILDEDAEELEWYVPASILPSSMQRSLNVINQFLENPLDLNGDDPKSLLQQKRRRRVRRRRSPSVSGNDNASGDDSDAPRRKKKEKKKKETKEYKSAQYIEDSDTDEAAMQAFFEREKALRQRMMLASEASGKVATMKSSGTKKRRKNAGKKKRKRGDESDMDEGAAEPPEAQPGSDADDDEPSDIFGGDVEPEAPPPPRPRPKPRPLAKKPAPKAASASPPGSSPKSSSLAPANGETGGMSDDDVPIVLDRPNKKKVMVISDDED
ncbi:timeless protein-domain-containing protein [Cristinia sonorae]|uniref:Timeless protein-domain-containing protein n=1 Tax=Cristinia sonorae TaxID=1940300 RepID=A0A8K0UTB3_9AGAR|nr:timeless protein-domain-containing protein [Cristinia sonorae]